MAKIKVVHGSVASGKSTYVKKNKGSNDLIFDFDHIMQSISGLEPHTKNENLIGYVLDIRKLFIEKLKNENRIDTAWIISTRVNDDFKKQFEGLNVEYIHMDTDYKTCIDRVNKNHDRQFNQDEQIRLINEYFSESRNQLNMKEHRQAQIYAYPLLPVESKIPPIEQIPAGEITDNTQIVEGYALRYNEPTVITQIDGIDYYEVIDSGALDGADLSDVPFKYNHDDSFLITARTRNKTLELFPNNEGLYIRANLSNTTAGNDLYTAIQRGDIDKMSFAFVVAQEKYDRQTRTRHIQKIEKLFDVSAVDLPAYDTTSISARSFFNMEIEKERKDLEKSNLRRKLLLQTFF
jgi:HK97 family phage prohead protease